jgi:hypothetical protein
MKRILLIGVVILAFAITVVGAAVPEEYVEEISVGDAAGSFIHNVPDASQPPSNILHFHSVDNWCAPLAAANSIVFLDLVVEFDWAHGVTGGLDPLELSEYLGYFMATNGEGSPDRENAQQGVPGTLSKDIGPGILDFAVWDGHEPPDVSPLEKEQVKWEAVHLDQQVDDELLFKLLVEFIWETGVPPILSFTYWNPMIVKEEKIGEEKILTYFAAWGEPIASTQEIRPEKPEEEKKSEVPVEYWDASVGHAVTAVGFLEGDPDGARDPLPNTLWVIVHDNWASTAENIAIPWKNINGIVFFGGEPLFDLLQWIQDEAER